MVIWIDGTFGVGKTSVAETLKERFSFNNGVIHLDADRFYQENIRSYFFGGGGFFPQNNIQFLSDFKQQIITEDAKPNAIVIVTMALTMDECRDSLFLQLSSRVSKLIHIILLAEEQTIRYRIENDTSKRDKHFANSYLQRNIAYLSSNYPDAKQIDTEGRSIGEVAEIIAEIIENSINSSLSNKL